MKTGPPMFFSGCILLLSSIFLALPLSHSLVVHASGAVTYVEPEISSAIVGETFSVDLAVADVQNLYGVGGTLIWNSSVLTVAEIDVRFGLADGVLYNPVFVAENTSLAGRYMFAATSTSPALSFNGSGNIVRIMFRAVSVGESGLDLETQLYDYPPSDREPRESWPIAHLTVDGFFQSVIPEFPDCSILFSLIILTLFACSVSRKARRRSTWRQETNSANHSEQNSLRDEKAIQ